MIGRSTERRTTRTPDYWRGKTVFRICLEVWKVGLLSLQSLDSLLVRRQGLLTISFTTGKPEDSSKKSGSTGSFPLGKGTGEEKSPHQGKRFPWTGTQEGGLHLRFLKRIRIFMSTLLLKPGEPLSEEARKEIFPDRKDAKDVSSLEPRRIALPLPGHEVSRASPQYQRMLEKTEQRG